MQLEDIKNKILKCYVNHHISVSIINSNIDNNYNYFGKIGYNGLALDLTTHYELKYLHIIKEFPEIICLGLNDITLPYLQLYLNDNIKIVWIHMCFIDKLIIKTRKLSYLKFSDSDVSYINNIISINILHQFFNRRLIKQKYAKKNIIQEFGINVINKIKYNHAVISYISPKNYIHVTDIIIKFRSVILYLNSIIDKS